VEDRPQLVLFVIFDGIFIVFGAIRETPRGHEAKIPRFLSRSFSPRNSIHKSRGFSLEYMYFFARICYVVISEFLLI